MQVAQLTKATLDVCHVDLNIILEATGNIDKKTVKEMLSIVVCSLTNEILQGSLTWGWRDQ